MTDFKVKDCFICNFCRNICKGDCDKIKKKLLSGNVDKNSQFYKDNIDLASDRKQIIDCLGVYCDKPCKYQNKDSKPSINILIKTIKYLGNKCNELVENKNTISKNMFTKEEKGKIKYTFAHWSAYQMTALNLKCWKFRFLFHDIEKPLLKLLGLKYETVRKIHRKHAKHHLTYHNNKKIDWLGVVIDWECSRFTKIDSPLNARQTFEKMLENPNISTETKEIMKEKVPDILNKLNL